VLLPDGGLDWAEQSPDAELRASERGLLEPTGPRLGPEAVRTCDVVVVPALAVDRDGHRLGRGGGSYDRALSGAQGLVVALLHDGELLDAVPTDPHDVAVHAVVTPASGLLRLDRPAGPAGRFGTMGP
jgi:5-formyltetrahydrofolate cyclo-ligase